MDLQTRSRYLKALGIPVWLPKAWTAPMQTPQRAALLEPALTPDENPFDLSSLGDPAPSTLRTEPQLISPTPLTRTVEPVPVTLPTKLPPPPDCSSLDWEALEQAVSACQLCGLARSRTRTVFGTGQRTAQWMIIGEAPGADEDRQGEPFVGKAGKLLNNMLAAIGLEREQVYIANILKCRPPNNRDPKPEEAALCRAYLERQISLVKPTLILVVGRIAAHNLLNTTTPLGRLRGILHTLPQSQTPVIVTYHPAYLLRQPAEKRKAWIDLQLARDFMASRSS